MQHDVIMGACAFDDKQAKPAKAPEKVAVSARAFSAIVLFSRARPVRDPSATSFGIWFAAAAGAFSLSAAAATSAVAFGLRPRATFTCSVPAAGTTFGLRPRVVFGAFANTSISDFAARPRLAFGASTSA